MLLTHAYGSVVREKLSLQCRYQGQSGKNLYSWNVDQHFSYKGFFRFDPDIDIAEIASLSQQSRKHELAAHFASEFTKSNKQVDDMRIPPVQAGALAQKHDAIIKQFQLQKVAF